MPTACNVKGLLQLTELQLPNSLGKDTTINPNQRCQSKPSKGQPSSKTTIMPTVCNVKGLLQVTELHLPNSLGKDTKALVLCDTACSNSWVSNSLAKRLGLHGTANQEFKPFEVSLRVKKNLSVGADVINIKALQETYPHLTVLESVTYCYGNIEMILAQNVYHGIRPLEHFAADEKCSNFTVRLPIGWGLSGPLPSSSGLVST